MNPTPRKTCKRYSLAVQQHVVQEIESGRMTISEARRRYDITGGETIRNWMRKLGKYHLLPTIVRVEMKDEGQKIKQLEKQKRQLESALAQAHLKIVSLESLIDLAEETYHVDIKKNFDAQTSRRLKP